MPPPVHQCPVRRETGKVHRLKINSGITSFAGT